MNYSQNERIILGALITAERLSGRPPLRLDQLYQQTSMYDRTGQQLDVMYQRHLYVAFRRDNDNFVPGAPSATCTQWHCCDSGRHVLFVAATCCN